MQPLDRERLQEILDRAAERLQGDWLLVGGALVAVWLGDSRRVTEDVDLVGMEGTAEERYALMDFALELGLPIEAVNSAADFFVRRIPDWRSQVEPFIRGPHATLFRPTPTLFVLLKAGRLSDQDLEDCLGVIAKAQAEGLELDRRRLGAALSALEPTSDLELARRRERLGAALGVW